MLIVLMQTSLFGAGRPGAESSSSFHPVTPFPFEGVTPPSYSVNVPHVFVLNYRLGDSVNIILVVTSLFAYESICSQPRISLPAVHFISRYGSECRELCMHSSSRIFQRHQLPILSISTTIEPIHVNRPLLHP